MHTIVYSLGSRVTSCLRSSAWTERRSSEPSVVGSNPAGGTMGKETIQNQMEVCATALKRSIRLEYYPGTASSDKKWMASIAGSGSTIVYGTTAEEAITEFRKKMLDQYEEQRKKLTIQAEAATKVVDMISYGTVAE